MSVLIGLAEALANSMNTQRVDHWTVMLRVVEIYCSILVRDPHARQVFIANGYMGEISRVTALPGLRSNFAASAVYAAFACDAEAMDSMHTEGNFKSLTDMLRDSVSLTMEQLARGTSDSLTHSLVHL